MPTTPDSPLDRPAPRGLDALFRPRSVAVVGTSSKARTIGREVLANLLEEEFQGVVFPVNPGARIVQSLKCYASVEDIPDPVDLAVVVVPAPHVPEVARQCARKGVGGLVVITAGFRETGESGRSLEEELLEITAAAGMRVVGPNCMGLLNTDPDVRLNATFAATRPLAGTVAFVSQSGALGESILAEARALGLGLSYFVSVGNRADVSTNDLLEYWEDDPRVGPILLYLESFGAPRRFPDIARRVSRKKPIVAVKSGRTRAGAFAARSHTGSLAGYDVAIDTLLAQCGVVRVDSMEELFATGAAFATQPIAKGPRVGIVTNAGGPGILATDACSSLGLELPDLAPETQERLRAVLPREASLRNPVDMIATAGPEQYAESLRAVLADPSIDALLVIFVTPIYIDSLGVARAIYEATRGADKPVLCCFMGKEGHSEAVQRLRETGVPVYQFPDAPARALANMARYRDWLERDPGSVPELDVDREAAASVVRRVRAEGRLDLAFDEARAVLAAYGFPFARTLVSSSLEETLDAAAELGFPLVLKATATDFSHKSDRGGVAVDLRNIEELATAQRAMAKGLRPDFPDLRFQVQEMSRGDREVILGLRNDPDFGPLLMFGLGGIHVEVLKDVAFRVHPITNTDARDMIRSLRGHALLQGVRGAPPVPEDLLVEMLLRLDRLVKDFPEIEEMDINPLMVGARATDCAAVDVRMRLAAEPPEQAQ
jgi:acetyltransferase